MPHTASAWKRLRKADKRRRQNRAAAKKLKGQRKELAVALAGTDPARVAAEFKSTQAMLDRAATKGYIHKNKAARLKSRLAKRMHEAAGSVLPKRNPTPRRKWAKVMAKLIHRTAETRLAALAREDAALAQEYPGQYVAYIDSWAGDIVSRRVVAYASDAVTFQELLARIDAGLRGRIELTCIPEKNVLTVQPFQLT